MRDRLIELLKTPHKAEKLRQTGAAIDKYEDDCVEAMVADFLLANGVIVPPCKVGDVVYAVFETNIIEIIECEVCRIVISPIKDIGIAFHCSGGYVFDMRHFGKTVFLTREEAEAKLKGGEG